MPRRTQLQRQAHQRLIEEALVHGMFARDVVRRMVRVFGLTPRQACYDLTEVRRRLREEHERLRDGRDAAEQLARAAQRCERQIHDAMKKKDHRRADRCERRRCKLLGMYPAQRKRLPSYSEEENRDEVEDDLNRFVSESYARAPRNPDGSVVLTANSTTPPPVEDAEYRQAIEQPIPVRLSEKRQERIDTLRSVLAEGAGLEELEDVAAAKFGLSKRQIRRDVRVLMQQLEDDGQRMLEGSHELQWLSLAEARRERIRELALAVEDHAAADAIEADRVKLLGLYPGDRPRRPEPSESDAERMFEVEYARLDRAAGHRHTVAELLPQRDGSPGVPGRFSWRAEEQDITPQWQQPAEDWDPADYLGEDLPPDYGDPNKRPEGVDPFTSP